MANYFMTLYAVYVPVGMILFAFALDRFGHWSAWGFFGLGIICCSVGFIAMCKAYNIAKLKENKIIEPESNQIIKLLKAIAIKLGADIKDVE